MKRPDPKQKQHPVVDVTGGGSKVWCCKELYSIGTWNVRFMNQGKLEVVRQEMGRVNIDILGISELKWTGIGEFNSSSHVWMWELNCKESWAPKNWCFWTVVLENTLEGPLDCKESQPVQPKGDQYWVFIGSPDVEAEAPILWPPGAKSWLIGKDPDAGKDWGQEEKGMTEDEMVGWHHQLDGHGFG